MRCRRATHRDELGKEGLALGDPEEAAEVHRAPQDAPQHVAAAHAVGPRAWAPVVGGWVRGKKWTKKEVLSKKGKIMYIPGTPTRVYNIYIFFEVLGCVGRLLPSAMAKLKVRTWSASTRYAMSLVSTSAAPTRPSYAGAPVTA
jgi:hypothetical protein